MNIIHVTEEVLVQKLRKLTATRLEHAIQLLRNEIPLYELSCKNYPPDRMEKYGVPYLARLHRRVELAEEELGRR